MLVTNQNMTTKLNRLKTDRCFSDLRAHRSGVDIFANPSHHWCPQCAQRPPNWVNLTSNYSGLKMKFQDAALQDFYWLLALTWCHSLDFNAAHILSMFGITCMWEQMFSIMNLNSVRSQWLRYEFIRFRTWSVDRREGIHLVCSRTRSISSSQT